MHLWVANKIVTNISMAVSGLLNKLPRTTSGSVERVLGFRPVSILSKNRKPTDRTDVVSAAGKTKEIACTCRVPLIRSFKGDIGLSGTAMLLCQSRLTVQKL